MYPLWLKALLLLAILGSGLMACVFFAFSNFVMQALHEQPYPQGTHVMQAVNRRVLNPGFMLVFVGAAVLCLIFLGIAWWQPVARAAFLITGALLYLVGVFGVTAAGNMPLNEQLAANDTEMFWREYLVRWVRWNHLRTLAASLAVCCFVWPLSGG
jgi:uncharacterized membrane protein